MLLLADTAEASRSDPSCRTSGSYAGPHAPPILAAMTARRYVWHEGGSEHELLLVHVPGTGGVPFAFGSPSRHELIEVPGFFLGATQVTQALWQHVMGVNP